MQLTPPFNILSQELLEELSKIIFFECLDTGVTGKKKRKATISTLLFCIFVFLVCHAGDVGTNWYVVISGCLEMIPIETYYAQAKEFDIELTHQVNIGLEIGFLFEI